MVGLVVSVAARRSHLASMRALLDAERDAAKGLKRAAAEAITGRLRTLADALSASRRLADALVLPIERARARGRGASLEGIRGEFAVARAEAIRAGVNPFTLPPTLPPGQGPSEQPIAAAAAKEIGGAYLTKAERMLAEAGGRDVSARIAVPVYALEEAATTQTAVAFADERERVERRVVHEHAGADWLPALLKQWDATLDVRTCRVCRRMNGQFRPFGTGFEGGRVPAKVHRRCRCISILIFAPLYLGRTEREAA